MSEHPIWNAALRNVFGHVRLAVMTGLVFACQFPPLSTAGSEALPERMVGDLPRIQLAAEQLVGAQLPSGLFPYDLDFVTGAAEDMNDMSGPNIVRQAGALFALTQYLESSDSPRLRESVAKALQAFADRSLPIGKGTLQSVLENSRVYNRWQLWGLLRAPLDYAGLLYAGKGKGAVISANGSYERAWTGATALALISEIIYRRVTADERFAKERQAWVEGLLALRVPGRGFREAPHYLSESAYVNGEAWLALAIYARTFPADRNIAETLSSLDEYLMRYYAARPSIQFYHWGTMAAAVRTQTVANPRFLKFMREQTGWVLNNQSKLLEERANTCAWVEGLATAFRFLGRDQTGSDPLIATTRHWIEIMMEHNLRMQILPRQDFILLENGATVRSPQLPNYAGAFLVSSDLTRMQVDVTAHCLSALIRMQNGGLAHRN